MNEDIPRYYPFAYPCPFKGCEWFVMVSDVMKGRMALVEHLQIVHEWRGWI